MSESSNGQFSIGVLTGGGDCPGLNAAIRAIVRKSSMLGWKIQAFRNGWAGILERDYFEMTPHHVSGILNQGGTVLGTSRTDPRASKETYALASSIFEEVGLDALITIGGDDTLSVANQLASDGHPVVGVPKTMDNDVQGTDYCIGFDSAVTRVTEALDYLHTTASSHHRAMVVEVMGREAGWVATIAGLAGGADYIVIPEVTVQLEDILTRLNMRQDQGKDFSIIVIAEGARIEGLQEAEARVPSSDQFGHVDLSSKELGRRLANAIGDGTGMETRVTVLGHVQRGGPPSVFDRVLATRLGVTAVNMVRNQRWGFMPALQGREIVEVALSQAVGTNRKVDMDLFEVAEIFF
jgi:6-phosphofructokinase 1